MTNTKPYLLRHGIFMMILTFGLLAHSSEVLSQCADTVLFTNTSFEQQTCCPTDHSQTSCIIDWDSPSQATPDYLHTCGYSGHVNVSFPPTPFPDGEGCVGFYCFYTTPNGFGGNEMIQTCIPAGLNVDRHYQISAYIGFNHTALVPSRDPVNMKLYGSIGGCTSLPTIPGIGCPTSSAWDVLAEVTYTNGGNSGWVYGISDCFQPAEPYDRFIFAAACDPIMEVNYNFMDVVELHTCFDAPPLFDTFPRFCQGETPPLLPSVSNNEIPITGSWSPSFISTAVPGVFTYTFTPSTVFCSSSATFDIEVIRLSTTPGIVDDIRCQGDGFEVIVNGETYNEANPSGTEILDLPFVCDSMVDIQLTFLAPTLDTFRHTDCSNSGYSITLNSTVFSITNSVGTETLSNIYGCDSVVYVALEFLDPIQENVLYFGCENDGYSTLVNSVLYNESNPTGIENMLSAAGCDSIVNVALIFSEPIAFSETYLGCEGDGYFIEINGTRYDESNPSGFETLTNSMGCDTSVSINLEFNSEITNREEHVGCEGDGYSIVVNSIVYDESNPSGQDTIQSVSGCDSIVTIDLIFNVETNNTENHRGCNGDGYAVTVNGVLYNETNPTGQEMMLSAAGCDSVINIDLEFNSEINTNENHAGCIGDGYAVTVNGVLYDETNPSGQEMMLSTAGCDSIVTIDLEFNSEINTTENHAGCIGDGYGVTVNGVLYNETNPTGQEMMLSAAGCDSIVTIELEFNSEINTAENHAGCIGDGYAVTVNGVLYNETNPTGQEMMISTAGCDSIVTIDLQFNSEINTAENHAGCIGDGYAVTVNGVLYNETNPTGQEMMISTAGCDSIVTINLEFISEINTAENHAGCIGDGYAVTVNGVLYNETNPTGQEMMISAAGCDSIVTINLQFNSEINTAENHAGCIGDGYAVTVNSVLYNETNPTGQEMMLSVAGCDSIVTIDLEFDSEIRRSEEYIGCSGDGFAISVNNIIYNESNPVGTETILTSTGCDSIIEIDLAFNDVIEREFIYTGCENDEYSISFNGVTYNNNNTSGVELLASGNGCDTLLTIQLLFLPATEQIETIILGADRTIDITPYIANIDSIISIEWPNGSQLSCIECLAPEFIGNESSTVTAIIEDEFCLHTLTLNILFEQLQSPLYIPNVFSPNNDGVNDVFIPLTSLDNLVEIASFDIFNRWGGKVFSRENILSNEIDLGWNGSSNGTASNEGLYVYNIVLADGRVRTGGVTLVR